MRCKIFSSGIRYIRYKYTTQTNCVFEQQRGKPRELMSQAVKRGAALAQKAKASAPPHTFTVGASSSRGASSSHALPQPPAFSFAPGEAGKIARRFVEKAKHPVVVVQDPKGLCKPICHEFVPRNGRSTFPILMIGHPDDEEGGPLVSNESAIYERKQRAKREAAAAADPQLALEEKRRDQRRQAERREQRAARKEARKRKASTSEAAEESAAWAAIDHLFAQVQQDAVRERTARDATRASSSPASAPAPLDPSPAWPSGPPEHEADAEVAMESGGGACAPEAVPAPPTALAAVRQPSTDAIDAMSSGGEDPVESLMPVESMMAGAVPEGAVPAGSIQAVVVGGSAVAHAAPAAPAAAEVPAVPAAPAVVACVARSGADGAAAATSSMAASSMAAPGDVAGGGSACGVAASVDAACGEAYGSCSTGVSELPVDLPSINLGSPTRFQLRSGGAAPLPLRPFPPEALASPPKLPSRTSLLAQRTRDGLHAKPVALAAAPTESAAAPTESASGRQVDGGGGNAGLQPSGPRSKRRRVATAPATRAAEASAEEPASAASDASAAAEPTSTAHASIVAAAIANAAGAAREHMANKKDDGVEKGDGRKTRTRAGVGMAETPVAAGACHAQRTTRRAAAPAAAASSASPAPASAAAVSEPEAGDGCAPASAADGTVCVPPAPCDGVNEACDGVNEAAASELGHRFPLRQTSSHLHHMAATLVTEGSDAPSAAPPPAAPESSRKRRASGEGLQCFVPHLSAPPKRLREAASSRLSRCSAAPTMPREAREARKAREALGESGPASKRSASGENDFAAASPWAGRQGRIHDDGGLDVAEGGASPLFEPPWMSRKAGQTPPVAPQAMQRLTPALLSAGGGAQAGAPSALREAHGPRKSRLSLTRSRD